MKPQDKSPNEGADLQKRLDGLTKELETVKNMLNNAKEVLTLEEAAAFLGVTKSTLYKMTHQQTIPFFKPNNKMVYFERAELLNWLRQNPVATRSQIEARAQEKMAELAIK